MPLDGSRRNGQGFRCFVHRHAAEVTHLDYPALLGTQLGDLRSATARSRMQAPIEAETGPMSADDGLGFDDLEDITG